MSEFVWPPPDNELELNGTLAPPAVRRALKSRRRGAPRPNERQRQPEHDQSESLVWPPAESDLTAPASVQTPEPAVRLSPGERAVSLNGEVWIGPDEVKLDRGPTPPPRNRTTSASRVPERWRIAFGLTSRRLDALAVAVVLALVIGGIWQTAGLWNTASQPPRSSHSSVAEPRPTAEAIDVAPPLPESIQAGRSPGESPREPREVGNRTATEPEPEAATTPVAAPAAAPRADHERQDEPMSRLATRSQAEQPSEAVVASAAIGVGGGATHITSRRNPLELTPLAEPSLRARSSSAPTPATSPPAATAELDARRPVPTAENASGSPTAGSRAALAIDEDHEAIEQLVARYQAAFDQRDADAAAAVWPSVERAALARAFADVQEQDLTLDRCNVAVEEEQATASCPGALSYVRRVGGSDPQVDRHTWTFLLERHQRGWLIAEVTAR